MIKATITIEVTNSEEFALICGKLAGTKMEISPGELSAENKPEVVVPTPAPPVVPIKKATPAPPAAKAAELNAVQQTVAATGDKTITLDDIRPLAKDVILANKKPELQKLLTDAGAANVSQIPEDKIQEVYDKLKALL